MPARFGSTLIALTVAIAFAAASPAAATMAGADPVLVAQSDAEDPTGSLGGGQRGSSAKVQVGELRVCIDAGCAKSAEGFKNAELMRGIYELLRKNEQAPVNPCETDKPSRRCRESGFSLFVMAGPLPAFANLASMTFKNIRLNDDASEISLRVGITGTFLGASASCNDFHAVVRIDERKNPVIQGTETFYCNWLAIGNIFWDYKHTFDFIDFTKGVMAGQFEFSAVGLLTAGGANGYGQHNLQPAEVALRPGAVAAAPTPTPTPTPMPMHKGSGRQTAMGPRHQAAPAPAPAAPAPAPLQSPDQQLAALNTLHAKGLIDDATYRERQDAILQRMFGAVPPPPAAESRPQAPAAPVPAVGDIEFGRYHALVIGNNSYQHLPKLRTAINDARTVAAVLRDDYGFRVTLLLDATRAQIIEALDALTEKLGAKDNLVIYYAGHGWLDEDASRGYWLATDAQPNRRTNWVSNATLTDTLKTIQAKHVMVIADSCYSGTLTRSAKIGVRAGDYWHRMAEKWTRVALVSGGLEPVSDGTGQHSPFATALISALKSNDSIMDGTQLFNQVRRPVMTAANQTPQYTDVRQAGHDGGDFLFVRKKAK